MDSIFTKIINREIEAYIIAEDEKYIAFLDVFPLAKGHALVVPKQQTDYVFNLEDDLLAGLHIFSKKIAKAIEKSTDCKRIGTAIIGLEVPHTHIHLIPINNVEDINFSRPKLKFKESEFIEILETIKSNL